MNPYQLDAHAERHDKLVRADSGEEDPDTLLVPFESDGQALKNGVHAQRHDKEEVPERSEHHYECSVVIYKVVQLNFTQEIEVLCMMFYRAISI